MDSMSNCWRGPVSSESREVLGKRDNELLERAGFLRVREVLGE